MVTSAGVTAVSHLFARRFLRLALEAEVRAEPRLARAHFLTAIRHDPTPEASLEFGRFLADAGQVEDALLVLQDGWQLALRRGRFEEVARCCRRLAEVSLLNQDEPQARRFVQRAAAAEMSAWGADEASLSSEQLLIESEFAAREGDHTRAVSLAQGALAVASSSHCCTVLRHLARLAVLQGTQETAAKHLLAAARSAREQKNDRDYAESFLELAHLLRAMRRGKLAVKCYRMAAAWFERCGRLKLAKVARRLWTQTAALERQAVGDPRWN
ncbi:hypothetical protein Pan44_35210 [Caulifigura coniformis]|uniref:Tetratricopeptide repeat protein n=1 Tax=Caulifigura coniformis TaxID=2527983 RepID=A0A517SH72_9PLAN|nr:hypothetical protein [Caulifigura coniformis]QDT55478.1 hypothetical protein Pan44_35210 [Caulifigura coniformis]